jgi:hypothetical protein
MRNSLSSMPVSKKIKTPLEKEVQNEICEYLQDRKYLFWRNNTLPVFSRNNAGNMAFRSMGKYAMKGLPDIIIIIRGKFIGVEVKRQGINELRPEQSKFQDRCIENGAVYLVVHSLDELTSNLVYLR